MQASYRGHTGRVMAAKQLRVEAAAAALVQALVRGRSERKVQKLAVAASEPSSAEPAAAKPAKPVISESSPSLVISEPTAVDLVTPKPDSTDTTALENAPADTTAAKLTISKRGTTAPTSAEPVIEAGVGRPSAPSEPWWHQTMVAKGLVSRPRSAPLRDPAAREANLLAASRALTLLDKMRSQDVAEASRQRPVGTLAVEYDPSPCKCQPNTASSKGLGGSSSPTSFVVEVPRVFVVDMPRDAKPATIGVVELARAVRDSKPAPKPPSRPSSAVSISSSISAASIYAHMKHRENSYMGLRTEISLARAQAAFSGRAPPNYKPWPGPARARQRPPKPVQPRPSSAVPPRHARVRLLASHLSDLERLETILDRTHERSLNRLERKEKARQQMDATAQTQPLQRPLSSGSAPSIQVSQRPSDPAATQAADGAFRAVRASLDQKFRRVIDLFREVDVNDDGVLSRAELAAVFQRAGLSAHHVDLDLMFATLDANTDGKVSYDELQRALRKARSDTQAASEVRKAPKGTSPQSPRSPSRAVAVPSPKLRPVREVYATFSELGCGALTKSSPTLSYGSSCSSPSAPHGRGAVSVDAFAGFRTKAPTQVQKHKGEPPVEEPPLVARTGSVPVVGRKLWGALSASKLQGEGNVTSKYSSIGHTETPPCAPLASSYPEAAAAAAAAERRREMMPDMAVNAFLSAAADAQGRQPDGTSETAEERRAKYARAVEDAIYSEKMMRAWKDDIITKLAVIPADWGSIVKGALARGARSPIAQAASPSGSRAQSPSAHS